MYPIFYIVYKGRDIRRKMNFKSIAYSLSEKEYNDFYSEIDAISGKRDTDLSASNIRYILATGEREGSREGSECVKLGMDWVYLGYRDISGFLKV
jgi:hypothetical protein